MGERMPEQVRVELRHAGGRATPAEAVDVIDRVEVGLNGARRIVRGA